MGRAHPCFERVRGVVVAGIGLSLKQLSCFHLHGKGEMGPLGRKRH